MKSAKITTQGNSISQEATEAAVGRLPGRAGAEVAVGRLPGRGGAEVVVNRIPPVKAQSCTAQGRTQPGTRPEAARACAPAGDMP